MLKLVEEDKLLKPFAGIIEKFKMPTFYTNIAFCIKFFF